MAIKFDNYGETPLDDISGLIPKNIKTKKELDDIESINIGKAYLKYILDAQKLKKITVDEKYLRQVHKDMLCDVWRWAGEYRTTQTTIGVEATQIRSRIYQLCDDLKFWEKEWEYKECATRFHHQLVLIHPFPNGNGRWARLMTEIWLLKMGKELPSWGKNNDEARVQYIKALQLADKSDYKTLERFIFES